MALPTLPHRTPRTDRTTSTVLSAALPRVPAVPATLPDAARELVLTAPMLLFAHGILVWLDDLGQHGRSGVIWFLAQAALIASVFSFVGLAAGLRHVTVTTAARRHRLATLALVGAIAGTGLTTWVALVRGIGGAVATAGAPQWLLAGGPILLAASFLALLALAAQSLALPRRSMTLGVLGVVLLGVPWDLIPLAALVILLALEPLLRSDPEALDGDDYSRWGSGQA
ncbi:MAG: hypothetical protein ACTHJJ_15125 [Intrasporangium sp.]|uniref:hypothetical protein n=1 Tax=Intrasporangium sp. TaxID=1925024 RepID=UPI003F7D7F1C